MKTALITGINGQDGSYLSELLLKKGYSVHGIVRRGSTHNPPFSNLADPRVVYHYCDMLEEINLYSIIKEVMPDEVYHLAAQSDVKISFLQPVYTCDVNAMGTIRLLESVRRINPDIRVYNAATSELYGNINHDACLNEKSRMQPSSPYACSKLCSYMLCQNYREAYGLHVSSGIMFNHESPRRGKNFVTRKITSTIAAREELVLGNIDAVRDWGYAPEYVEAMWSMLQQDEPGDYVIATGETHSVQEFLHESFRVAGYEVPVVVSDSCMRPSDVVHLRGDARKAKTVLGWVPRVRFKELVRIMVEYDIQRVKD